MSFVSIETSTLVTFFGTRKATGAASLALIVFRENSTTSHLAVEFITHKSSVNLAAAFKRKFVCYFFFAKYVLWLRFGFGTYPFYF